MRYLALVGVIITAGVTWNILAWIDRMASDWWKEVRNTDLGKTEDG